jgi:hypothetical protein
VQRDGRRTRVSRGTDREESRHSRRTDRVHTRDAGSATVIGRDGTIHDPAPEPLGQITLLMLTHDHEQRPWKQRLTGRQLNTDLVVARLNSLDLLGSRAHTSLAELGQLVFREFVAVGAQQHVIAPPAEQQRPGNRSVRQTTHPELNQRLIPYLPPMTMRTSHHRPAPSVGYARHIRQFVPQPGRQHHRAESAVTHQETVIETHVVDSGVMYLDAVLLNLTAPDREQLGRRRILHTQVVVHMRRRTIPGSGVVEQQHLPPRSGERQRRLQPGHTPTDHCHVVGLHAFMIREDLSHISKPVALRAGGPA